MRNEITFGTDVSKNIIKILNVYGISYNGNINKEELLNNKELYNATSNKIKAYEKYLETHTFEDLAETITNGWERCLTLYRTCKDYNYRKIAQDWTYNAAWIYLAVQMGIIKQ